MERKWLDGSRTSLSRRWQHRGGTWWWAVFVIVVPVALSAAVAMTALLMFVNVGGDPKSQLELIKTGLTVGAGTGGVVALVLAGRRQWSTEHDAAERRLTELYVKAVEQLGSDKPVVRHGGLYALERVAQDNPDHRQVVVDVICAYLRAPFQLPGAPRPRNRSGIYRPLASSRRPAHDRASSGEQVESPTVAELDEDARQEREIRLTAQRILTRNLKPGNNPNHPAKTFWKDINLDLTGATLINFNLLHCQINKASFIKATFTDHTWFQKTTFTDHAMFEEATFINHAWFLDATFTRAASFYGTTFTRAALFDDATFTGHATFDKAIFTSATSFDKATFTSNTSCPGAPFAAVPGAQGARIRADSSKPDFKGSSWPLGWTAELPERAEQAWVRLVPVPIVLVAPGEVSGGRGIALDAVR
ncbi:hypothetical protein BS329_04005 [Amycolatopsis coloradensis]|uniref:Pentapeptide repeat-containing protein n=1 Tax=Amycolatopsis coloradensis TaxID=76021 RepID=A0A1R0L088_9PSEU|nr:pentapeptide repeat-containing protein [Amycolatopsis coloradensis]OLZ55195.1 hypothetical protein BS329_04005 [Amycolatopsis coloradensis]